MQILLRAVLILLIVTAAVVIAVILYKRTRTLHGAHFVCPRCGSLNTPTRLFLSLSPARADSRLLQCVACGRFGYMPPVWDVS